MLEVVLAVLAVSAAAGMRSILPLLVIGCLAGSELWSKVPILEHISPQVLLGVLVAGSLLELLASKNRISIRISQILELMLSPLVGGLLGVSIARATDLSAEMIVLLGMISGLLAFVLQLVQIGWFYRLRGLPLWAIFTQDFLCVILVVFAVNAPQQGGMIALILFWFAIRSASEWRKWSRSALHKNELRSD
jgi:Domain of unknown function (DUF4126)